jgi:hypothetical protein
VDRCRQAAEEGDGAAATAINPLLQAPGPPEAGKDAGDRTARAVQRGIRMSPKKLNLFMPVIRRRHIQDALAQCRASVKKAARLSEKVRAGSLLERRLAGACIYADVVAYLGLGNLVGEAPFGCLHLF